MIVLVKWLICFLLLSILSLVLHWIWWCIFLFEWSVVSLFISDLSYGVFTSSHILSSSCSFFFNSVCFGSSDKHVRKRVWEECVTSWRRYQEEPDHWVGSHVEFAAGAATPATTAVAAEEWVKQRADPQQEQQHVRFKLHHVSWRRQHPFQG